MDIIEQLAAALAARQKQMGVGYKHDASGTPITVGYVHGPGGSLTWPGVDPAVFHTIVGNMGILGQLPVTPSVFTNPTYSVITGVQGVSGTEKTGPCADAPTAGLKKACIITAPFGQLELATPELDLNRLGKRNDPSDPMDLTLVGSPIHQMGPFAAGARSPATPADILQNEVSQKMWELNVAMHRLISQELWTGNPTAAAAGGAYIHFAGFQQLINTGYVDAPTNTACPSLNSDLKDFQCERLDADDASQARLVDMISELYRTRLSLALRTGVSPVRWVLAMREDLFHELTAIWPCAYLTYRCQMAAANEQLVVEATQASNLRDAMRRGKYLLLEGEQIPVVIDDGIPVDTPTTNANVGEGCQCSDIYLIPMSIVGGRAVTYLEHADYNNPSVRAALSMMVLGRVEGPFLTWPRQTNQCVVWQTKIEPRLVVRTPWLAGRIQNVEYCPTQQARTPFPDDPYFVDGGLTTRPGPSYYTPWANR